MNHRAKSIKNLLFSLVSQVVAIAFGLILPRMWVVSYGSEVNGLLTSLSQFLVYLSLFEAGIGAATMQALYRPVAQDDWNGVNGVLSASNEHYRKTARWYLIGLVALCIGYPLVVDSTLSFFTICGAVFFSGIGNVVNFYFQGKYVYLLQTDGKLYITTTLTTIVNALINLTKIVLIYLHIDIVLILAVSFLIQCTQAVFILWYVRRHYPQVSLKAAPNYEAVAQKNSVLVHQISSLIFRHTDVMILTIFCDLKLVSVYSMYKLVTSQLDTVLTIPLDSIKFSLGQTYHTNKALYTKRIRIVESYYSAAFYALFSVALFLLLPFMRLYTANVTDINYIDPWLAILFVACSLLERSRTQMLDTITFAGHFRETVRPSIIESAINLTVSLIGVIFLGIYGVLLGTVAALLYRSNDIIIYGNRKLLECSPWKSYSIYLVDIVLFFVSYGLLNLLFDPATITSYWRFIAVGFETSVLSLIVVVGGQTLIFPHCRAFVKQMFRRFFPNA